MPKRSPRTTSDAHASYESHFEHAALFEFSKVINSSIDLRFVLSHILLTIMGKLLSAKGMAVLALGRGRYRVEMGKGFPGGIEEKTVSIQRMPASLLEVKKLNPARYPWIKFFREQGVALLLPMFIADLPIGLLAFGERLSRKKLDKREVTYLRSLANISATAIEKSHTIQELQLVNRRLDGKIQELNTLFELGKEFGALLDPDKLVRLLLFSLLGQVGVHRYLICLKEGPDMKIVASRMDGAVPQGELLRELARLKAPTPVEKLIVRHTVDPREILSPLGITVVVPMQLQGENRGLILLGDKFSREPYLQADLDFLSSLANLAIISLENARLFKEALEKQKLEDELMIAREIQKGLLPNVLAEIPGADIAATNVSSKQVGGDYYDLIVVDSEKYIIAIGDVSGKGTPAALLMANLQATIRALVPLRLPLSELTERVNHLMCPNTGGNKFVTFFWGIIDTGAMSLTYVNAGHNYPYLLHADGSVHRLEKGGMILGVMETAIPYEEEAVHLSAGDILVLFTDGVSEAMSSDQEEYGEERLEAVIRGNVDRDAQEIIDAVHADILRHTKGALQSDDITMMVMRIRPH